MYGDWAHGKGSGLRAFESGNPACGRNASREEGVVRLGADDVIVVDPSTEPLVCPFDELAPVRLELVSQSPLESLWDELVRTHHYLGYRRLLGHRLKYVAWAGARPVAALSWSAAARKLRVRDCFVGWSEEQRRAHLPQVAANSRFLILPWVQVPNMASHVLSMNIRRLKEDWSRSFSVELLLLETFVDPTFFDGASYKAANWRFIGYTAGCAKKGHGYVYHGVRKEVYVYELDPLFRRVIGCALKPYSLSPRPPRSIERVEELHMILRHADWNPDATPPMELTEEDLDTLAEELMQFHALFHDCLGRREHERLGLAYLSGLLSQCEAKSVEPIALEFLGKESVRSLQRFMKIYGWDDPAMLRRHQGLLSQAIAAPEGMVNVDASEFPKKGTHSVGVAHQYCGHHGKTENCQSGVFVGYSSYKGYGLLAHQLYMPEIWFSEGYRKKRQQTLVPEDLVFQTKAQIASKLLAEIAQTGLFPAKWIGCDASFGSDWEFLESLPETAYYFAAIRSNLQVFLEKPQVGIPPYKGRGARPTKPKVLSGGPEPFTVAEVAEFFEGHWKRVVLAEGAKGPIVADVAALRVYPAHEGLPRGPAVWLFLRRTEDGKVKYAFSNAPEDIPFEELCEASVMRWPIEQCFEDGKSHVGMDEYEHRSWPAWHRHMLYVFLGLHFLLRMRLHLKKNSIPHAPTSEATGRRRAPSPFDRQEGGARNRPVPHNPKPPSVPIPSKETPCALGRAEQ